MWTESRRHAQRGVSTVEVLASATILSIALLSIATMFLTSHASLARSGDSTHAVALARHVFEDAHTLSFAELDLLHGFDTASPASLPASGTARGIARRWRYAAAGENAGWPLVDAERARWPRLADPEQPLRGRIAVEATTPSTRTVTVSVAPPTGGRATTMTTIITRTMP